MCDVEYDNFVGLLLEVIGKVVSTKRVAQKLEPKVPAIAFGVNPHKFEERHEKQYKKGDCRWASFENTVTAGVRWANHPQSYWQSKNNSNLDWDHAATMDGSITDFFQQTFGPSPIYELAPSCHIYRGCIGAQSKEQAYLVRQTRVVDFLDRMFSWKACGQLVGTGKTDEDWNAMSIKERARLGVARLWMWKACGQLVGTGKTEEEWNAMSIKERARLGVARLWTWKACGQLVGTGKTEEEWNALPLEKRMKLGAALQLTTDVAQAKATSICLDKWMKLSNEAKNCVEVERLWTWKACGQLVGTGKTEEDWNALPLDERMKLGAALRLATDVARAKAASICLDKWMKLSNEAKNCVEVEQLWTWKACGQLVGTGKTEEDWNALPLDERMKLGAAAKLAPYHEALWNGRYGELCQFITNNGHSHVPFENRQLQSWVGNQKKAYKNGTMSLAHKKLMEEICNFGGDDEMKAAVRGILDKHTGGLQVIQESVGELDVTEDSFTISDVLIVTMGNVKNLPGNQGLRAAISKHMPDDPSATGGKQFSSLAELVIDEIESLHPPGCFLEPKPGNCCFCTINRDRVIQLIKKRFRHMKKENDQKNRDKGCPVTTLL
jgi:hypothetical protein